MKMLPSKSFIVLSFNLFLQSILLWSEYLCSAPNSYVEILTPKVMVLRGGALGDA